MPVTIHDDSKLHFLPKRKDILPKNQILMDDELSLRKNFAIVKIVTFKPPSIVYLQEGFEDA